MTILSPWKQALAAGARTYVGTRPCRRCGGFERSTKRRDCLVCEKNRKKVDPKAPGRAKQRWVAIKRDNPVYGLYHRALQRARRWGLEFTITPDDIVIPEVCPVYGMPLKVGDGKVQPYSPSLDRIDNTRGYTPDNIVVVSDRANRLKRDATLDDLKKLVEFYEHRLGAR